MPGGGGDGVSLPVWILVFGGAISFALGALTGFWLGSWMKDHPGQGWQRYRMTLHKEALWSSFLCFAVAGWVDRLPLPEPALICLALALVATGWGAVAQYFVVARAGLTDLTLQRPPIRARVGGALAMGGNLAAIGLLLLGAVLAFPGISGGAP